jgi:hypothetical protein
MIIHRPEQFKEPHIQYIIAQLCLIQPHALVKEELKNPQKNSDTTEYDNELFIGNGSIVFA